TAGSPTADGFTWTLQGNNTAALGGGGGNLGYSGIAKSVAVKFDLYDNSGEGTDSTGLYLNGVAPMTPSTDMTGSGIDLHSGHVFQVHMTYDGTTLAMTITDATTAAKFTTSWTVNIPSTVGGNTAFAGFTGGTGGLSASQQILSWVMSSGGGGGGTVATPTFTPGAGTYLGTQTVMITDTTAGSTIYYTLDGTQPGTAVGGSTMQYTGVITVTSTKTIKALATAPSMTTSATASALYTIETQVATPTFLPVAGTYASAQSVTISTTTTSASIYYTTNGSTPTSSSTLYSTPVNVGASETLKAIATRSGYFDSNVGTAAYVINSGGGGGISFGSGFTTGSMVLNGNASISGTSLTVTPNSPSQASSAWFPTAVNVQNFTNDFTFQLTAGSPTADGFTFALQNNSTAAIGGGGGNLGYMGIGKSIAVKFDLYDNSGEGTDSTGLYLNGVAPMTPAVDMTGSGIDLHSGHVFQVHMTYDGTNLAMTITDNSTAATFTQSWAVDIPGTVGSTTAFAGFTGGTGGISALQKILTWTLTSGSVMGTVATPTFNPAGGSYTSTQNVTIATTTSGATIYYTTDGSNPTTGSTMYVSPVAVAVSETLKAIAVKSGSNNSAIGTAVYNIGAPPVINFPSGFSTGNLSFNGSAKLNGTRLQLTDTTSTTSAGSSYYTTPENIQKFTTDFTFQQTSPNADGMAFVIQNVGTTALGGGGGGLGYGSATLGGPGIVTSMAIKFDLFNNNGEGTNSTGLYTGGASPTTPATTFGGGVNLHSGDIFAVHIVYNGTTLTMTITDTANTSQTYTQSWTVNLPSVVGANAAYIGFSGGIGGLTARQEVITWTYTVN
ncbi:MAG TPA: chitobiase/beta-hexosaminidase C-terminal domain-containing protein, partial [Candidatus Acidoferrum sp.]